MPEKVRVYIVQTGDCWAIRWLLAQLNDCQNVFNFIPVEDNPSGQHLRIRPTAPLREVLNLHSTETRRKILESYLTERDWAEQTRSFLRSCPEAACFNQAEDLAVSIGAGVYVLDTDGTQFSALREDDAYACIYDYRISENAVEPQKVLTSDGSASLDAFAAISLLCYESLFDTSDRSTTIQNRSNRARYVVANLTHFIAARSFWTTLAREHSGQACVMETNLGGGDYIAGYYTPGLCEACIELLNARSGESRVSFRLRRFSEPEVVKALNTLCILPNRWDRRVRVSKFVSGRLIPLLAVGVAVGLTTNLLAGYASTSTPSGTEFQQLSNYIRQHGIAVDAALVSTILALLAGFSLLILRLDIP